ncbi:MAG: hypothetical protein MJ025_06775 [Victivallaceae bacterium]|nr:hypothetical protein [Victivallaceae bacterium]
MAKNDSPEKKALMKELSGLGNLIRGSLIHATRKCGKKTCRCWHGGPEHQYNYLSISTTHARNKQVYVSVANLKKVENGVAAYKRAWEILEELSALNLAELKDNSDKQ